MAPFIGIWNKAFLIDSHTAANSPEAYAYDIVLF